MKVRGSFRVDFKPEGASRSVRKYFETSLGAISYYHLCFLHIAHGFLSRSELVDGKWVVVQAKRF